MPTTARDADQAAAADGLSAVGPYIAPVKLTGDGDVRPGNLRELIRLERAHDRSAVRSGPRASLPRSMSAGSPREYKKLARMYLYDDFDRTLVTERVAEFRDQVARRLSGELTEDEFKPLRLMNGVYLQLHAYMLRTAIPYGTLSSTQLRMLAHVARRYDRGYGHFTTRQNIQYHWIKLEELPDAMADLASVGMHGMQTSGNCVRNITTDQWAGVAPDEIEDPRIWAELVRQHVTLHPEFSFLPRKFKIAVGASSHDRAALRIHDLALQLHRNGAGETGFEVMVGGGLGRTPFLAKTIKPFLHKRDVLSYVEAILRTYNQFGRRDNIYKARIKILVHELGAEAFAKEVEAEWQSIKDGALALDPAAFAEIAGRFRYPHTSRLTTARRRSPQARRADRAFDAWMGNSVANHKAAGLRHRHAFAQAGRRHAGRRHRRANGCDRRSRRPLLVRRNPRRPRAESGLCRMSRSATCRRFGARSTRSASRRRMSGSSPTSSPAPASIIAASPMRARSRSRRRSRAAFATTTSRAISAGCTSTFPAASTPAAIIMSAISAFSASRRTARSFIRSRSAARPTRTPSSAR